MDTLTQYWNSGVVLSAFVFMYLLLACLGEYDTRDLKKSTRYAILLVLDMPVVAAASTAVGSQSSPYGVYITFSGVLFGIAVARFIYALYIKKRETPYVRLTVLFDALVISVFLALSASFWLDADPLGHHHPVLTKDIDGALAFILALVVLFALLASVHSLVVVRDAIKRKNAAEAS